MIKLVITYVCIEFFIEYVYKKWYLDKFFLLIMILFYFIYNIEYIYIYVCVCIFYIQFNNNEVVVQWPLASLVGLGFEPDWACMVMWKF